jgi:hypothetical protein
MYMYEYSTPTACADRYELRFTSLYDRGHGYAFACDAQGHVDIDHLSDSSRMNYLYARTLVGREFSAPTTVRVLR